VSDAIFADGFESGSLSAWSANGNDGGDLNVSPAAALVGEYGMRAVINDEHPIGVQDQTPNGEAHYRVRFYFDPNSIAMARYDSHVIFYGYTDAYIGVLQLELQYDNGYQIRAGALNDAGAWVSMSWFTLSDAPHCLELDWQASSGVGANDGSLMFWLDGQQKGNLANIDNDTRRIDMGLLGALSGIDTGTRGVYYFDAFESRESSYIGP
jgi:hypothetical protein